MTSEDADAARRDYAKSVQARGADKASAALAAAWRSGNEAVREHLAAVRQRLAEAGIDPDLASEVEQREAALKQLHELDEPRVRQLVEAQVAWLQKGAKRLGIDDLGVVTASSYPSGSINAMCANDPGDGTHHVFADGELIVFCNALAKLVATAFTSTPAPMNGAFAQAEPLHGPTRALFDKELSKRVVDLFVAVLFTGRSRVSEPYVPDRRSIIVAAGLAWGMEAFAIAHELGHTIAGHLSKDTLSVADSADAELSQAQEFEADGIAFDLTLAAAWDTVLMPFQLLGPYAFLKGIELLERGQAYFATKEKVFESHPGTPERLSRLRIAIPSALEAREDQMLVVQAMARIDSVFTVWSGQLMLFLEHAKAQGYEPKDGRIPYRQTFERPPILG